MVLPLKKHFFMRVFPYCYYGQASFNTRHTYCLFYLYNLLLVLKSCYFASFLCVHSRCPPFLFISDEHIVKQTKTSMLQNNIYNSLFIIYFYDFVKIFNIVGLKKNCGHHEKSWSKSSYFPEGFASQKKKKNITIVALPTK